MPIDITTSAAQAYIGTVKDTTYIDSITSTQITQAVNYSNILDIVIPTMTDEQSANHRLLSYYIARYNQVTRIITAITTSITDSNLEIEYDVFNTYTTEYAGTSPDMDTITTMVDYAIDGTMGTLRELRRQQKILSNTISTLSTTSDNFENISTTLEDLQSQLGGA